jgi:hypothetical protein
MNYKPHEVSAEEMYFFDLRGYLVIPNVLDQAEIDACNAALDAKMDEAMTFDAGRPSRESKALGGDSSRIELTGMLGWAPALRKPFRKLLVHPSVVSRLNEFSGKGFRLDHGPLLIRAQKGAAKQYGAPDDHWDEDIVAVMWGPYANHRGEVPFLTVAEDGTVGIEEGRA